MSLPLKSARQNGYQVPLVNQLLRLPFYTNMTDEEQKTVIAALKEFTV